MSKEIKEIVHWWKYTTKQKTTIKIYQVWLIIIIEAIIVIFSTYSVMRIKKYRIITENDEKGYAINCYQNRYELRCYIDTKVKQYGAIK